MRAKTITEIQNFEREGSPLSKMGIGGVNFTDSLVEVLESWKADIERVILGKTITADMKISEIRIRRGMSGEYKKNTKKVNSIIRIYDSQSIRAGVPLWVLVFDSEDGNRYVVDLDQKIWIHES